MQFFFQVRSVLSYNLQRNVCNIKFLNETAVTVKAKQLYKILYFIVMYNKWIGIIRLKSNIERNVFEFIGYLSSNFTWI